MMMIWFIATLSAGHLLVAGFIAFMEWLSGTERPEHPGVTTRHGIIPNWFMGMFERCLAFALVYNDVGSAGAILAGWIAAKLATNWNRGTKSEASGDYERAVKTRAQIALMAGVLSVSIGATGGYFAAGGSPFR